MSGESGIYRVQKLQAINSYDDGTSRTIKSQYYKTSGANFERTGTMGATGVCKVENEVNLSRRYRIRKLTPKECYRLMGFDDKDYYAAAEENSQTQLYKQAGNSIVVSVLCAIFSQLGIGAKRWNEMSIEERRDISENKMYPYRMKETTDDEVGQTN